MNGTEMVRRLRVHLDDQVEPYKHSTDKLWIWLQNSYKGIQLESEQWDFMHVRGLLLSTQVGVEDYSMPTIRTVSDHSLYYVTPGTTAHQPMWLRQYEEWSAEEQAGVVNDGPPRYLIHMPGNQWKIDPAPEAVYNIYADYWLRPTEMADLASEPVWEEEFHELVLFGAMQIAARLKPESPESIAMLAEVDLRLPTMKRVFNARNLPGMRGPGPLL